MAEHNTQVWTNSDPEHSGVWYMHVECPGCKEKDIEIKRLKNKSTTEELLDELDSLKIDLCNKNDEVEMLKIDLKIAQEKSTSTRQEILDELINDIKEWKPGDWRTS